ncbi:MAG: baseplate J/gp47 family protein [Faecalibacterium sp.]
MPEITSIKNMPDVSFIDNKTILDVRGEMVSDYENYIQQATGTAVKLPRVSRDRMILYSCAAAIYQGMQYTDRAGKMNFLKWSYSDFLDHLGKFRRVTRNPASAATTTLRFTVSTVRPSATAIPKGTRAAALSSIYFATDAYAEIPAKASYVDVPATCVVAGSDGNNLAAGEVAEIVDPLPYIKSVSNITETSGGADTESDESFAERIYLAPDSYSTAGPEGSYRYWAKTCSSAIGDVVANSKQAAGEVDISFLMADGTIPGEEDISTLQEFLQNDGIRPLTDKVVVSAPSEIEYSISLTYYIDRSNAASAVTIQSGVDAAVQEYISWQRKIGRDVNPSKLVSLIMEAGAKRVDLASPAYTKVGSAEVSTLSGVPSVAYGGLEDD